MTTTDKMLAHKDAGVGVVTFNNPERHNAVSLDMWEATKTILDVSPSTTRCASSY